MLVESINHSFHSFPVSERLSLPGETASSLETEYGSVLSADVLDSAPVPALAEDPLPTSCRVVQSTPAFGPL